MSILGRLFKKRHSNLPDLSQAVCYVCGEPSYYKCEVCGRYTCMVHTKPGTRSCMECSGRSQDKARPAVR